MAPFIFIFRSPPPRPHTHTLSRLPTHPYVSWQGGYGLGLDFKLARGFVEVIIHLLAIVNSCWSSEQLLEATPGSTVNGESLHHLGFTSERGRRFPLCPKHRRRFSMMPSPDTTMVNNRCVKLLQQSLSHIFSSSATVSSTQECWSAT